jgi:glutamate synthase domain-containing protein 3
VVSGDVGHMSAFTAQAGRLMVCGDAGYRLRDFLHGTRIYVKDTVASRGSDCVEKESRRCAPST